MIPVAGASNTYYEFDDNYLRDIGVTHPGDAVILSHVGLRKAFGLFVVYGAISTTIVGSMLYLGYPKGIIGVYFVSFALCVCEAGSNPGTREVLREFGLNVVSHFILGAISPVALLALILFMKEIISNEAKYFREFL
jgi:hypothetical protein